MKRAALALILPLLLFVVVSPRAFALQARTGPVTIPFDLATRHIMVKVRVNNSRPLSFILDTGAHMAIIRSQTAEELGLSLYGSVNSGGAGAGSMAGQRVKDARWTLLGLEGFSQPVTLALPFPALPAGLGQDVDGIIGGEFIREFVVDVDYQARALTIHDRKTFDYRGKGHTLPLEFSSNSHPVVRATVTPVGGKPVEDRFVLDLGSGAALILHSPFVATHGLLGPQSKTLRAIGMGGAGGRSVGRVGRAFQRSRSARSPSTSRSRHSHRTRGAHSRTARSAETSAPRSRAGSGRSWTTAADGSSSNRRRHMVNRSTGHPRAWPSAQKERITGPFASGKCWRIRRRLRPACEREM